MLTLNSDHYFDLIFISAPAVCRLASTKDTVHVTALSLTQTFYVSCIHESPTRMPITLFKNMKCLFLAFLFLFASL